MVRGRASEAASLSVGGRRGPRSAKDNSRGTFQAKSGFDGPMIAPWRKTVSIFQQPVTLVHTTSRDTKSAPTNSEQMRKSGVRTEKPRQVFWAKQLEGLSAMVPIRADASTPDDYLASELCLASKLEPMLVPSTAATASLCSALHSTVAQPILGQSQAKKQMDINPAVFVNTEQPLVQAVVVGETDIAAQERRVLDARRRLQEARRLLV